MRATHVLYVADLPGREPLSGAENHLWTLLPGLLRAGVDTELIVVVWRSEISEALAKHIHDLESAGVRVSRIHAPVRRGLLAAWRQRAAAFVALYRQLTERRNGITHIHLEIKYTPFIARFAGCTRIVFSVHNDTPRYRPLAKYGWFWALNKTVAHYIAISARVRSFFLDVSGANDGMVTTIYYGVDPPSTEPIARRALDLPADKFIVGFVGRLTEQKNLLVLIDALRQRPNLLGVLIGAGPQHDELRQRIADEGIANVRLLGPLPAAERAMPAFDVLCLPSLWEGLGLVLIEAMLRRVPIVGSNRGAIPDILDHGRFGIVCEPTVEGLLGALDQCIAEPRELELLAERAYEYARSRFTVERMVRETIDVYDRVERRAVAG